MTCFDLFITLLSFIGFVVTGGYLYYDNGGFKTLTKTLARMIVRYADSRINMAKKKGI